uniref:Uncharacterized protein n=1 Tax=viral metagenome TaxID=1070528 RepID=A0A6M3IJL7_9ZZZZ
MKKIAFGIALVVLLYSAIVFAGSNATSGLTAQTFIDRVRYDLNAEATTDTFFSNTILLQWIDEALKIIASTTRCMESSETVTLTSNTISYSISTGHYDISHVIYDSGVTDSSTRFSILLRTIPGIPIPEQQKRPKFWWEWESKLNVFPVPNSEISGTTVIAYLVSTPTSISAASDSITTPAYFDAAILYYVKAKGYFRERSDDKGVKYLEMFNSLLNDYKNRLLYREVPQSVSQEGAK